ncbi:MAG: hypothetical protein KC468_32940 [Myxococcales bacterium]|nr:hypothetical protein [Myxococcales bacterium]
MVLQGMKVAHQTRATAGFAVESRPRCTGSRGAAAVPARRSLDEYAPPRVDTARDVVRAADDARDGLQVCFARRDAQPDPQTGSRRASIYMIGMTGMTGNTGEPATGA